VPVLAFGVIIGANVLLSTMFLLYIYPLWILLFIEFYWGKMEKRLCFWNIRFVNDGRRLFVLILKSQNSFSYLAVYVYHVAFYI
jgi:hypothetical protein